MTNPIPEFDRRVSDMLDDATLDRQIARTLEDDDQSRDRYLDMVILHVLLAEELEARASVAAPSPRHQSRTARFGWKQITALSSVALLLFGLSGWWLWPRPAPPFAWRVTPAAKAQYEIIGPDLIRLERGELELERISDLHDESNPSVLTITTPQGEALVSGRNFLIGTHATSPQLEADSVSLTRILALSGMVTLTTALGTIDGTDGDLLAAEEGKAPTKIAVQANSQFALALYRQLSSENKGDNLFFSPYSVSGALAMTLEGARGQTAQEMGTVLGLPAELRRVGDGAQLIPWRTALMHTGIADINQALAAKEPPEVTQRRTQQLASLEQELNALNRRLDEGPGFRQSDIDRAQELADKITELRSQVGKYELKVANALWCDHTFPLRQSYADTIKKYYEVGSIHSVDFRNDYLAARNQINDWCSEKTNGRIPQIMPPLSEENGTLQRLVLTNAIYFKAGWKIPFRESRTRERSFHFADGQEAEVPTMRVNAAEHINYAAFAADGTFFPTPKLRRYNQTDGLYPGEHGFVLAEIPYRGDQVAMVLVVPNRHDGLAALEGKLTPDQLTRWLSRLEQRELHLQLPRFKLNTTYALERSLSELGMRRAFRSAAESGGADFSGLTSSQRSGERVHLTSIHHKAFIEVNEKGTEAAAAVSIGVGSDSEPERLVPFTPTVKADRPFLFLIRERSTGSVLFLGRVTNPVK